jgi:hypothetical protein
MITGFANNLTVAVQSNQHAHGLGGLGGVPFPGAIWNTPIPVPTHFTLEVRDPDGVLLQLLTEFYDGKYRRIVNAPSTLDFSYPFAAAEREDCVPPNEVWFYGVVDGEDMLLEKFIIATEDTVHGATLKQVYHCESRLANLNDDLVPREIVPLVSRGNDERIVTLFSDNTGVNWGGTIPAWQDNETQVNVYQPITPLHYLREVVSAAYGSKALIRFNPDTDSVCVDKIDETAASQNIRWRYNMLELTKRIDYKAGATRIYAYGEGITPEGKLSLLDAGESEEYIEATPALGVQARSVMLNFPGVTDPDVLKARAEEKLTELNRQQTSFRVSVLSLLETNPEFVETWLLGLELGIPTQLLNERLGVDETIYIVEITQSLKNPLDIQIELDRNLNRSIVDTVAELAEKVNTATLGPLDVLHNDGSRAPNVERVFHADDLADLYALEGATPGLDFRNGDIGILETDPEARERVYRDGAFVPFTSSPVAARVVQPTFEVTSFPPISTGMPFTRLQIFEEDAGWNEWYARGDSTGSAGDGSTVWKPTAGWTALTGEPGTTEISSYHYAVDGSGRITTDTTYLTYALVAGVWVSTLVEP